MLNFIDETVLVYHPSDLADWKAGRREKWLNGCLPAHVLNQPTYHFGEYFVLADYSKDGWKGHRFYALGDWEPTNPKLQEGRDAIERCFEKEKLDEFRRKRVECGRSDGKGEPDLFLHHPNGGSLFLEVKKERDQVSREQLECLGQIRGILHADIGIVYLAKAGVPYRPKRYELDVSGPIA
jgi:hypothetical protein